MISLTATLHAATAFPPLSLRFLPGQFRADGVTWQEVVASTRPGGEGPPSTEWRHGREAPTPSVDLSTTAWPAAQRDASTADERGAGVRRLFVPVTAPGAELPPLRTVEGGAPESHLEPRLEIAATRELRVACEGETISLRLPIFESLGRLAPVREFRPLRTFPPPDAANALLARLPEPILPANLGHLSELYREAWRMLLRLVKTPVPESGLPGPFIAIGAGFSHYQFVWDTSFTTLAAAYGWRELPAHAGLDLLLSRQHDGGYVHRETDTRVVRTRLQPESPVARGRGVAVVSAHRRPDAPPPRLPPLAAHHRWLVANRRLPDGTY